MSQLIFNGDIYSYFIRSSILLLLLCYLSGFHHLRAQLQNQSVEYMFGIELCQMICQTLVITKSNRTICITRVSQQSLVSLYVLAHVDHGRNSQFCSSNNTRKHPIYLSLSFESRCNAAIGRVKLFADRALPQIIFHDMRFFTYSYSTDEYTPI